MNKEDIIYDLVKGMKEDQVNIKEDIVDIKSNIRIHAISLDRYNELLNIHIAGVDTLKQLHIDNEQRIAMLEEPVKVNKAIVKKAVKVAGFILTVLSILYYIKYSH